MEVAAALSWLDKLHGMAKADNQRLGQRFINLVMREEPMYTNPSLFYEEGLAQAQNKIYSILIEHTDLEGVTKKIRNEYFDVMSRKIAADKFKRKT